jgi:hypothetical protein
MMQTILTVKQAIARREGMNVQRGSLPISQWKRDIIANTSLWGGYQAGGNRDCEAADVVISGSGHS